MADILPLMAVKRSGLSFATSCSLTATILPQPLAGNRLRMGSLVNRGQDDMPNVCRVNCDAIW